MGWLRRALLSNWYLKLLSLGLAYVLWQGVASAPPVELQVVVPLLVRNLPANLRVAGDVPPHVQVTLRGSEARMHELPYEDLAVIVDLKGMRPGNHLYPLSAGSVEVPYGVEVIQIEPPQVELELVLR